VETNTNELGGFQGLWGIHIAPVRQYVNDKYLVS